MEIVSTRLGYPYTAFPTRKKIHGDYAVGTIRSPASAYLAIKQFRAAFILNNRTLIQAMLDENAVLTADAASKPPYDSKDQGLLERRKVNRPKQPILLLNKMGCLWKSHHTTTLKFIFSQNLSGVDL